MRISLFALFLFAGVTAFGQTAVPAPAPSVQPRPASPSGSSPSSSPQLLVAQNQPLLRHLSSPAQQQAVPIPTRWPNAQFQSIPTTWPKVKFELVAGQPAHAVLPSAHPAAPK